LALEDNPGGVVLFSTSHPERITEMVQKPFAVEILRPAREEIAKMPLSGSSPACDSNEIVRFKITMRRSLPGHEGPAPTYPQARGEPAASSAKSVDARIPVVPCDGREGQGFARSGRLLRSLDTGGSLGRAPQKTGLRMKE